MSTQPIERPGVLSESKTIGELLQFDDDADAAVQWREQMQDIEKSQRSAENEQSSVRIR